MSRGKKIEKKCKNCGIIFYPRIADVNRGWGKFCSKSCKAKKQVRTCNKISSCTPSSSLGLLQAKMYNAMTVECEDPEIDYPTIDDFEEDYYTK